MQTHNLELHKNYYHTNTYDRLLKDENIHTLS